LKKVDSKYICNFFNDVFCFAKKRFCSRLSASAAPRPENLNSGEKDALFGLATQIIIEINSRKYK
jgi:hypothetical protein